MTQFVAPVAVLWEPEGSTCCPRAVGHRHDRRHWPSCCYGASPSIEGNLAIGDLGTPPFVSNAMATSNAREGRPGFRSDGGDDGNRSDDDAIAERLLREEDDDDDEANLTPTVRIEYAETSTKFATERTLSLDDLPAGIPDGFCITEHASFPRPGFDPALARPPKRTNAAARLDRIRDLFRDRREWEGDISDDMRRQG